MYVTNDEKTTLVSPSRKMHLGSLALIVLIIALTIDSILSDISTIINKSLSEQERIALFASLICAAVVSGVYVTIRNKSKVKNALVNKDSVRRATLILPVVQYVILGLLVSIALQIAFTSTYQTIFYVSSLVLGWSTGVILMALMSFKLFEWYRSKKISLFCFMQYLH
jgi:hypothetical protein